MKFRHRINILESTFEILIGEMWQGGWRNVGARGYRQSPTHTLQTGVHNKSLGIVRSWRKINYIVWNFPIALNNGSIVQQKQGLKHGLNYMTWPGILIFFFYRTNKESLVSIRADYLSIPDEWDLSMWFLLIINVFQTNWLKFKRKWTRAKRKHLLTTSPCTFLVEALSTVTDIKFDDLM